MDALLREELGEVNNILLDIYTGEIEEVEAKERFKITSLESANWALRKLAAISLKENEIRELMDKEIKRIEEWAKHELNKLNDSTNFFEGLLTEYYIKEKEIDPKFKVSTPYGKITARKQQDKWIYNDEIVLESLKKRKLDKFIRIKEEVNKSDLKKEVEILENACVQDGQVLGQVKLLDDGINYANIETGEVYDFIEGNYEFYKQLIVHDGRIIEGVRVEQQPDSIDIKVEV